ncbi:hypothetical protein [Bacillus altitudinis]|nr:hypothetical protein [Bacillus altitudinis]
MSYWFSHSIAFGLSASEEIFYLDVPSNRVEAFQDTNTAQYRYLKERVLNYLNV